MVTKLSFKVYDTKQKRYISGWQDLQHYGMGIMNDKKNPEIISICFFDEPDCYLRIEHCEGER